MPVWDSAVTRMSYNGLRKGTFSIPLCRLRGGARGSHYYGKNGWIIASLGGDTPFSARRPWPAAACLPRPQKRLCKDWWHEAACSRPRTTSTLLCPCPCRVIECPHQCPRNADACPCSNSRSDHHQNARSNGTREFEPSSHNLRQIRRKIGIKTGFRRARHHCWHLAFFVLPQVRVVSTTCAIGGPVYGTEG